jgi:hypothetical protein
MQTLTKIPKEVAALIPAVQLKITKKYLRDFTPAILRLQSQLEKCPKICETDRLKEHPAIFHYFFGSSDIYICEFDRDDLMFGYSILNGDLYNSEWGYSSLAELRKALLYNIDYCFKDQSIEAALYTAYPKYFKKPLPLMA